MRSLLILSAAFALLVTYLESMDQQHQTTIQPLLTAKVIRSPVMSQIASQTVETKKVVAATANPTTQQTPLNLKLKLPTLDSIQLHYSESKSSVLNLFKHRRKETVTYNAELVFDAEKGESITGGKVNIKIPFG